MWGAAPSHQLPVPLPQARTGSTTAQSRVAAARARSRPSVSGMDANTTHARPGLRGLLDLLSHDDLVHTYKQGPRTFLYEFDGVDLYQRRAADMSF